MQDKVREPLTLSGIRQLKKGTKEHAIALLLDKDAYLQRLSGVLERVFQAHQTSLQFNGQVNATMAEVIVAVKECLRSPWSAVTRRREALVLLDQLSYLLAMKEESCHEADEKEEIKDGGEDASPGIEATSSGSQDDGLRDPNDGIREIQESHPA